VNCQTPLLTIRKHACTLTLSTAHQVYRKTPAKLHKLLPALATQAAHTSTVDAFNHLKHEVCF